jgi:predicted nucleic acid-binding protein
MDDQVILVDTNAWIEHLRHGDERLKQFLLQQRVRTCEVVLGELFLGMGMPKTFMRDLLLLPLLPSPSAAETRGSIERNKAAFAGAGVGWADAQVILTAAAAGARIHTSDRAVRKVCRSLQVSLA